MQIFFRVCLHLDDYSLKQVGTSQDMSPMVIANQTPTIDKQTLKTRKKSNINTPLKKVIKPQGKKQMKEKKGTMNYKTTRKQVTKRQ